MKRKPSIKMAALVCALVVAGTLCMSCGSPSFSQKTQDKITSTVQAAMKAGGIPGAVVGVWQEGKGSYLRAFGTSGLSGTDAPMKTSDVFREASITKTFTAVEILKLVEKGKLSLDDTISKWDFSEGLPNRDMVTLEMLLNHTSGYPDPSNDYMPFTTQIFETPEREWTPEELVQWAIQDPNYLPPGQEYRYSNFGYCLLGMVIEHVKGKPLATVLQDDLLTPLSLKNTKFDNAKGFITSKPHATGNFANVPENLAPGMDLGPDKVIDTTSWNTSWTWAAGSMCGTAEDLKTWIEADAGGKLLDPATVTLQQKTDVVPTAPGNPTEYGLGIIASPQTDGTTIYWHNGAVPGYSTFAGNDPDTGLTIVVLYNMNPTASGDPLSATRTALELSKVMGFTPAK